MSRRAEALMGTMVTIEAAEGDDDAIDRAFGWFRTVEAVCTRFDPASELSQLTRQAGQPFAASRLLFEAVQFALHIAEVSGGAFDPTVGAVMHRRGFHREHRTGAMAPVAGKAAEATYRDVIINPADQTIRLARPLQLDLGAVAKGLAVDLAARELEVCRHFAIDAGGDLYLGGLNPRARPWTVGIRHPRRAGDCIASIAVSGQAVCTSGDYERLVNDETAEPGDRQHHIVDPRTGSSPGEVVSVTVVAPSAMLADALGTAAFVLGDTSGLAFLEQMNVDGLIVTRDLRLLHTPDWTRWALPDGDETDAHG